MLLIKNKVNVDRVTICWSQRVFQNNFPVAIRQCVDPLIFNEYNESISNYKGWTIEGYPREDDLGKIVTLRVSSCSRDLSWIKASFYSETDQLLTYGSEEQFS